MMSTMLILILIMTTITAAVDVAWLVKNIHTYCRRKKVATGGRHCLKKVKIRINAQKNSDKKRGSTVYLYKESQTSPNAASLPAETLDNKQTAKLPASDDLKEQNEKTLHDDAKCVAADGAPSCCVDDTHSLEEINAAFESAEANGKCSHAEGTQVQDEPLANADNCVNCNEAQVSDDTGEQETEKTDSAPESMGASIMPDDEQTSVQEAELKEDSSVIVILERFKKTYNEIANALIVMASQKKWIDEYDKYANDDAWTPIRNGLERYQKMLESCEEIQGLVNGYSEFSEERRKDVIEKVYYLIERVL